jgi:2-haloacid dehalogenase
MAHSAAPDPAQAASATSAGIRTLVFDVLGTVADEAGSIAADTAAAPAAAGADPGRGPQLSDEWTRRLDALTDQVVAGEAPWRSNDALRRAALHDAAGATGLAGLPAGVLDDLALAGHRLMPWPDSAQALRALAGAFTVVALSNAGLAQLARAYKPDPAACRLALDLLGLTPGRP